MIVRENSEKEDAKLEEDVHKQIGQQELGKKVYVVASGGHVHLAGAVERSEEKNRIGSLVEKVPGVRTVTNHLRVRPWETPREVAHF